MVNEAEHFLGDDERTSEMAIGLLKEDLPAINLANTTPRDRRKRKGCSPVVRRKSLAVSLPLPLRLIQLHVDRRRDVGVTNTL